MADSVEFETEGNNRSDRTSQFSKTKMCKFEIIGMCAKGPQCPFAHTKDELKPLPDLTCTKLCKQLIQTGECQNVSCKYAHNRDELRATSTYHKTKMCRFAQLGHCALGAKCNFAHSVEEIRAMDEQLVDEHATDGAPSYPQDGISPQGPELPTTIPESFLPQPCATANHFRDEGHSARSHRHLSEFGNIPLQFHAAAFGSSSTQAAPASPINPPLAPLSQQPIQAASSLMRRGPPRRRGGRRQKGRRGAVSAAVSAETTESPTGVDVASNSHLIVDAASSFVTGHVSACSRGLGSVGGSNTVMATPCTPMVSLPPTSQSCGTSVGAAVNFPNTTNAWGSPGAAKDSPAYVTQTASLFVVKNTFLELGAFNSSAAGGIEEAGAPLRPIRSAAGRLDYMGGGVASGLVEGTDVADITNASSGSSSTPSAGTLVADPARNPVIATASVGPSVWHNSISVQAGYPDQSSEYFSELEGSFSERNTTGARSNDISQLRACYEAPSHDGFVVDQEDDGWQVKNTFLTFSPQVKPIRAVRTADGALCDLGGSE